MTCFSYPMSIKSHTPGWMSVLLKLLDDALNLVGTLGVEPRSFRLRGVTLPIELDTHEIRILFATLRRPTVGVI